MPSKQRESSSRRRLLPMLLPVLMVAAALTPASAMAQEDGGEGDRCSASVRATQDERVAAIEVDCGEEDIDSVEIDATDQGNIEENAGTTCEEIGNDVYTCSPDEGGSLISVRFNDEAGPVCADPRLAVDFTVALATDGGEQETETIEDVDVEGCGDFENVSEEDSGGFPEGGVDSGAGGTANGSGAAPSLPLIALPVLALALAGTAFALRRRVL